MEIQSIKIQQLDKFTKVVAENEAAIGRLMERVRAIQADPKQNNLVGAEEIRDIMRQALTHSRLVDAAYLGLSDSENDPSHSAPKI
jgi:hypothetical protein